MKRLLKAVVQWSFEAKWGFGFTVARHLKPTQISTWTSSGERRVLVVAPHPDDEVAGCGGTLLRHRGNDDRVVIVAVSDGRRSGALGLGPERMAARRQAEMERAAEVLDVELEWLGLPEGEWTPEELTPRLAGILDRERPHVVYTTSRVDFHFEHERVALALARALDGAKDHQSTVRAYPVAVPLAGLCNLVTPIDTRDPRLLAAFDAYSSQRGALEPCLRHRRFVGRRHGHPSGAEELWELSSGTYARIHREHAERPGHQIFRGLRYYAWSDPLAYLRGRGERQRLLRDANP